MLTATLTLSLAALGLGLLGAVAASPARAQDAPAAATAPAAAPEAPAQATRPARPRATPRRPRQASRPRPTAPEDRAYEPPTGSSSVLTAPAAPRYERAPTPNRGVEAPGLVERPRDDEPRFGATVIQPERRPGGDVLRGEDITRRGDQLRDIAPGGRLTLPFAY